jgi:Domain of unknown function (DUF4276)
VKRIKLYVEGGGDSAEQKAQLRFGFDGLFGPIKVLARSQGVSFSIVCAGDRNMTHRAFANSREQDTLPVLLVDSEEGLPTGYQSTGKERIAILKKRDGWDFIESDGENVHFMVRCMETWIVADPNALARFYGQGFEKNQLPSRTDLEMESKRDVHDKLRTATRKSQKGEYQKLRHASKILPLLESKSVAGRCSHFARILKSLESIVLHPGL